MNELDLVHRPQGRRLGIVLVPDVRDALASRRTEAARARACHTLLTAGQLPLRRLAVLQPAPGRQHVTREDTVWFLSRFGHEYTAVLVSPTLGDLDEVHSAARAAGCAVLFH